MNQNNTAAVSNHVHTSDEYCHHCGFHSSCDLYMCCPVVQRNNYHGYVTGSGDLTRVSYIRRVAIYYYSLSCYRADWAIGHSLECSNNESGRSNLLIILPWQRRGTIFNVPPTCTCSICQRLCFQGCQICTAAAEG